MTNAAITKRQLSARQTRVVKALISCRSWIWREDIDRIAGASNGPEIISQLRHIYGIEIDMRRVESTDRDGKPCKPGKYKITQRGIDKASSYFEGANA